MGIPAVTGLAFGLVTGVNLLATGTQGMIAQYPDFGDPAVLFFPLFSYAILRSKAGPAITLTARIRAGGNGTHDDVMPLFVVPAGAAVGVVAMPPLVVPPFVPPNLRVGPILFEVERGAVGPTTLTGGIMVVGMLVSG